jgi:hypothetical protein
MDVLEQKAIQAVSDRQNKKQDLELKKWIDENYKIEDKKEIAFILEYIKCRVAYKAYQKVYGEHINKNSAGVSAHRILKKAGYNISDFLENSGHSVTSMMEVLDELRDSDPKEYMKYATKLHGLDTQKVEMS